MKLKILGSSSSGNCYILYNDTEALIIECGIRFNQVKAALGFDLSKAVGAIVTHEHGDHAKYVRNFIESYIPVYMSDGTAKALNLSKNEVRIVSACESVKLGNFTIMSFDVKHDAKEPVGYLIHHKETGVILFATDTYYLRDTFDNLSNILIECNYSQKILEQNVASGKVHPMQMSRVARSHMSLETCKETLLANDLSKVNNILLIHLSPSNSDASFFQKSISAAIGKEVAIAEQGVDIEFNKTPF